jgi:hypothetical protein
MKRNGEVIEATVDGDALMVLIQAKSGHAEWACTIERLSVRIPATRTNRRMFHVGRHVGVGLWPR